MYLFDFYALLKNISGWLLWSERKPAGAGLELTATAFVKGPCAITLN